MMTIQQATTEYEAWLGRQLTLLPEDLRLKHQSMGEGALKLLCATYYRWAQLLPAVCPQLGEAPRVLSVGDLHVNNFGTWRDSEGRLVWGVNDFDEAASMPYPNDLVRLAVSAHPEIAEGGLVLDAGDACDALLAGYAAGLEQGGEPFILAERHAWFRKAAMGRLRDPERYWKEIEALPTVGESLPAEVHAALDASLPQPGLAWRAVHRLSGLGSLGRQRWAALVLWRGGLVAREAKAITCSAYAWSNALDPAPAPSYQTVLDQAVRCVDPFVRFQGSWVIRRLAPDCSPVELAKLDVKRDEQRLLEAMGRETANIHLATPGAAQAVLPHIKGLPRHWLAEAAEEMRAATIADWEAWKAAPGA